MRACIVVSPARLAALLLLAVWLPQIARAASPITITVNDHTLNAVAYRSGNRVMVPMRAIFEALRARVSYDERTRFVSASTAAHRLVLSIGTGVAEVDGVPVKIDAPARIVADRTYVPLRFVAQALGAQVGYDNGMSLVAVYTAAAVYANVATSHLVPVIAQQNPLPNSRVDRAYPIISARIIRRSGAPIDSGSVHLYLDGSEVTSYASFNGDTLTYIPQRRFNQGWHDVFLEGVDENGASFSSSWSFYSLFSYDQGFTTSYSGFDFYPSGGTIFYPGDWMHFVLLAPPGGSAYLQLCSLGSYPFISEPSSSYYYVTIPAPLGYVISNCNARAYYMNPGGVARLVPMSRSISVLTKANYVTPVLPLDARPGPIYRHVQHAVESRALPKPSRRTVMPPGLIGPPPTILPPHTVASPRATPRRTLLPSPRPRTTPHA